MKQENKVLIPALLFLFVGILRISSLDVNSDVIDKILAFSMFVPVFCFVMAHFSYRNKRLTSEQQSDAGVKQ